MTRIGDEKWTPCHSSTVFGESVFRCCKHRNHFYQTSEHYSPEHYYQWYRPLTEAEKRKLNEPLDASN